MHLQSLSFTLNVNAQIALTNFSNSHDLRDEPCTMCKPLSLRISTSKAKKNGEMAHVIWYSRMQMHVCAHLCIYVTVCTSIRGMALNRTAGINVWWPEVPWKRCLSRSGTAFCLVSVMLCSNTITVTYVDWLRPLRHNWRNRMLRDGLESLPQIRDLGLVMWVWARSTFGSAGWGNRCSRVGIYPEGISWHLSCRSHGGNHLT